MPNSKPRQRVRTVSNVAGKLRSDARYRARKKDMPFDLEKSWIEDKLRRGVCEVTGLPLDITESRSPWSPSLERVNNDQNVGYIPSNVKVVASIYNTARRHWRRQDILLLSIAIADRHRGDTNEPSRMHEVPAQD